MKSLNIKSSYFHAVLVFIVALLFFNPYNIAKYMSLILFIYVLFQILNKKRLNVIFNNIQLWCLIIFCFFYTVLQVHYDFIDIHTAATYLLYFIMLYIFGLVIVTKMKNERQMIYYLYAVIIGLSLFGIVAVIYSTQLYGTSAGLEVRVATIPWMKDVQLAGTGIGMYVCLGISLSGLLFIKTNVFIKALNALIVLLSLYASVSLANRTGLLIGLLSVILIYVAQTKLNSIRDNIKIAASFIFQCFVLFVLFNMNCLNVKSFWQHSNAFNRFADMALSNDPRLMAWGEAFKGVFTNPLGGKQAHLSLGYAHNLWLDVGYSTGFLPFIILIIFTLITLKCYVRLLHNENISRYFKYLVTTMLCGFLLTFMVEPAIEGNYLLFGAFCLVSGVIKAIDKTKNINTVCK
jgi:hypothetical protein